MNIGRTALLVLTIAVIPGGVVLLLPAIYRRSPETARHLAVLVLTLCGALRLPAARRSLVRRYLTRGGRRNST